MKHILMLMILCLAPMPTQATDIYFRGVVGNPIVEAVSEKLQNEVESIGFTSNHQQNCHEIMTRGTKLFQTLKYYYDGDKFFLNSCRGRNGSYAVEYVVNGRRYEMNIVPGDPSPKNLFNK